jgi:hypothetical protein
MACGCRPRLLPLAAVALMLACLGAQPAGATTKRPPHGKAAAKKPPRGCPALKPVKEEPPVAVVPVAGAKVAVLAFSGDDPEPVRRQIMQILRAKRMKTMTGLRPVDSPEQFREMSVTLSLVAYIDGEVAVDGTTASATIFVRNGSSGMRTASATFAGERRSLGAVIAKELWERIGPAMSDAVGDAAKPHKGVREPMRLNAGAPLTNQEAAEATD